MQSEHASHTSKQTHHHHSHARDSLHVSGHHLLQAENLSVSFIMPDISAAHPSIAPKKILPQITNLSLSVHSQEIVAVVGASGAGKSVLAHALMGLYEPNEQVTGHIWFDGKLQDAQSLSRLRGHGLSLVPQSVSYLDPLMKVGKQVREGLPACRAYPRSTGVQSETCGLTNRRAQRKARTQKQRALFERYNLSADVEKLYPHELSGGMARRILLMCALMDNPRVIIADEPTVGLDINLATRALQDFRTFANTGGGVLLITHNIELALRVADRVAVFYQGYIVEETAVSNFARPETLRHPYTRALWHALPEHDFCAKVPSEEESIVKMAKA